MIMAMTIVLPEPVAILSRAAEVAPVAGDLDTLLLGWRGLGEPDQRLDGLQLAEEEPPAVPLFGVVPVFQQASGDARDARVVGLPPLLDPRADPVDEREIDELAGVVEGLGAGRCPDVSRGSPSPSTRSKSRVSRSYLQYRWVPRRAS